MARVGVRLPAVLEQRGSRPHQRPPELWVLALGVGLSATVSVGFLPEIGFVHEVARSKLLLAYDLQEPFRWLVDLSVIELLTDSKVDGKADFMVTVSVVG
jgi:hypothetical protein